MFVGQPFPTEGKCTGRSADSFAFGFQNIFPNPVMVQESSDIQQIAQFNIVVGLQIFGKLFRVSNVAPDHFCPDIIFNQIGSCHLQSSLIIIGSDQK